MWASPWRDWRRLTQREIKYECNGGQLHLFLPLLQRGESGVSRGGDEQGKKRKFLFLFVGMWNKN